ncbi:MAG: hypothetical protein ABWY47_17655 [Xanthobacteraceae bacterium]|jgi:hypothetical protein
MTHAQNAGHRKTARTVAPALLLLTISAPAWGQAVTFAELDGSLIEAHIVRQQVIRREAKEFPVRIENNLQLVIGPGDKIQQTVTATSHTPRGIKRGETRTSLHTLERPREVRSQGGGNALYVFLDGTLTFLRTYKGGAYRRAFAFGRGKEGLTCAVTEAFAREDGVGAISLDSFVDGVPTIVVSSKPLSSSCRIAAGRPAAMQ